MQLIPFAYNGRAVPVQLDTEGKPLWRAADVGKALEYKGDMGQHIRRLDGLAPDSPQTRRLIP